jgi:hypothetical protein
MGLPTALLIILIGAALMTFAFDAAARFRYMSFQQERMYLDHTLVTGYIEEVKGRISKYNSEKKHALKKDLSSGDVITMAEDLLLTEVPAISGVLPQYNLNLDIPIPERQQALTLRVYDVSYAAAQVAEGISSTALARMPPPIPLMRKVVGGHDGLKPGGDTEDPSVSKPGQGDYTGIEKSEREGSYLIRVELFNVVNGQKVRTRLLEEAFVQIASGDKD